SDKRNKLPPLLLGERIFKAWHVAAALRQFPKYRAIALFLKSRIVKVGRENTRGATCSAVAVSVVTMAGSAIHQVNLFPLLYRKRLNLIWVFDGIGRFRGNPFVLYVADISK